MYGFAEYATFGAVNPFQKGRANKELAELTTTNITKEEHPQTMSEHARVAERGGSVARVAKEAFEEQTGKKVVSSLSMKQYLEAQQQNFVNKSPPNLSVKPRQNYQ